MMTCKAMTKPVVLLTAIGMMAVATPAHAEVDNVGMFAETRSEACSDAKQRGENTYGGTRKVTGFGSCQCSPKRSSSGQIYGYDCNVDVYYQRNRD